MTTIDEILRQIVNDRQFVKLKNIVENSGGWHDNEKVFDHCIRTKDIAEKTLNGDFINNSEAKKLFLRWADNPLWGVKQKDLSLIIALIHDCGKILHYSEAGSVNSLITDKPNMPGEFMCPGHEYWGAKIVVPEILKSVDIPVDAKKYIAQIIEYHGIFSTNYFPNRENWPWEQQIADIKSYYCGFYIEGLFNMYCDGYYASAFITGKKKIEELFNDPNLYIPRTYFIPDK